MAAPYMELRVNEPACAGELVSGSELVSGGTPATPASRTGWPAAARRALDLAVAVTALLLLAPLLVVIAGLVRLESPGSPIFRQRRVGRDEALLTIYKFRTMLADADAAPHRAYVTQLITGDAETAVGHSLYKLVDDDRVTRVGRVLRCTSLDELPQLINVVRGEMSLVGPRPVIPYELEHYAGWYRTRFAVKPGLTGLWQVSGRNERTYEEMVGLDIEYVERQSLRLDLAILARTAWVLLTRKGAA